LPLLPAVLWLHLQMDRILKIFSGSGWIAAGKKRMNENGGSADIYDSPLDLNNANDPRALALRLIPPGKAVLELGPATGRVTRVLSERGCKVVAVERDEAMAPNLERYCSRVVVGDVERLSLEEVVGDQRFDVILAGDFLEHLAHPLELLQELKKYLSSDGYVVASIPNIAHGSVRLSLLEGKFEYKDIGILDRTHLRFFTLDSILRLFTDAGFAIVDVQRVRQDAFTEPYIDRPSRDKPELSAELKQFIEDDPDAATVQFVVQAFPVNSSAAQLHMLLTLQSKIQEKEKMVLRLEKTIDHLSKTLDGVRGALQERDLTVSHLEDQIRTLQYRIESARQQADGAIREKEAVIREFHGAIHEREAVIRELHASNEELRSWLTKYKDAKEKLLPSGSLRDRVARKLAGSLLSKSAPAPKPSSEPEPSDRR
jgi:2-polyprenyl-3-methyl-5-hydroxy-6-metoxy-1,4-benzoquinol methylase